MAEIIVGMGETFIWLMMLLPLSVGLLCMAVSRRIPRKDKPMGDPFKAEHEILDTFGEEYGGYALYPDTDEWTEIRTTYRPGFTIGGLNRPPPPTEPLIMGNLSWYGFQHIGEWSRFENGLEDSMTRAIRAATDEHRKELGWPALEWVDPAIEREQRMEADKRRVIAHGRRQAFRLVTDADVA